MPVGAVLSQQGTDLGPSINTLMAREQADAQGFLALLIAESNLNEQARRPVDPADDAAYWPDVSASVGQQTVLYAQSFGLGDGTATRANIDYVMGRLLGDVDLALDIAAQQYGAYYRATGSWQEACAKYNGGPAAHWATIPAGNRANYQRGYDAAAAYMVAEAPVIEPPYYDDDLPAIRQTSDWGCSVASTAWALQSRGIDAPYPALEGAFRAAGLATPAVGLLDGSGTALAAWLRTTWGLTVEHTAAASWAWITERAGQGPMLAGGGQLYHWVAVRAVGGEGLLLANPAPSWRGIGDELSRAEFDDWGPWAALWMPVEAEEDPTVIADLTAQLAAMTADRDDRRAKFDALSNYASGLGHDVLLPTVAELRTLAAASSRTTSRDVLQAKLSAIADRLAEYVVDG